MCRNCILALFLPLYLNLYNNIQTKLTFTKVLLTKTDKSWELFKSWEPFCGLVHQARNWWRRNLATTLFKIACTVSLPIHFLRVSCTAKRNVEKSSITVSVNDAFFYNNLPDSLRWDKVNDIVSHFLNIWILVLGSINFQYWKMHFINNRRAPNKPRVRINAGSYEAEF